MESSVQDNASLDDLRDLLAHVEADMEAERQRLCHALHGDLGSSLTSLAMHLTLLAHKLPPDAGLADRLENMQRLLKDTVEVNRRLQAQLGPAKLPLFGLKAALADALQEFAGQTGLPYRLDLPDEELSIAPAFGLALFRVVEEALRNITRHAQASAVEVILDEADGEILLTIKDDGRGFPPALPGSGARYGLRRMHERVLRLHGSLAVDTGVDTGTVLRIRLPASRSGFP
jgi:signal transduction histidine kinase